MATLPEELEELHNAQSMIGSTEFKKYIEEPMRRYRNKQRDAYDCESLKELWFIKGKKEAVKEFFRCLDIIEETKITKQKEYDETIS